MFNREYFERVLDEQVAEFGQTARVDLTLCDGHTLELRDLLAAHDGYVIIHVYPAREVPAPANDPDLGSWVFDLAAIAYEDVASVRVTLAGPDQDKKPVGFHTPRPGFTS